VLLLVALPAVLAKIGEEGSGKRVPKQIHAKGEYQEITSNISSAVICLKLQREILTEFHFCKGLLSGDKKSHDVS
jgi:hypothetical protein